MTLEGDDADSYTNAINSLIANKTTLDPELVVFPNMTDAVLNNSNLTQLLEKLASNNIFTLLSSSAASIQSANDLLVALGAQSYQSIALIFPWVKNKTAGVYNMDAIVVNVDGTEQAMGNIKVTNPVLYSSIEKELASLSFPPTSAIAGSMIKNDDEYGYWSSPVGKKLLDVELLDYMTEGDMPNPGHAVNFVERNLTSNLVLSSDSVGYLSSSSSDSYLSRENRIGGARIINQIRKQTEQVVSGYEGQPDVPLVIRSLNLDIDCYLDGLMEAGAIESYTSNVTSPGTDESITTLTVTISIEFLYSVQKVTILFSVS